MSSSYPAADSASDNSSELTLTGIDQVILTELCRADEQIRVLTAKLDALPETAEVGRLEAEIAERRRQAHTARRMAHDRSGVLQRLRSDAARLRARRRDAIAGLRAAVDVERRRDFRHDVDATERRLKDAEEEIAREERTLSVFGNDGEAAAPPLSDDLLTQARVEETRVVEQMQASIEKLSERSTVLRAELSAEILARYEKGEREQGMGAAELAGTICRCCCIEVDASTLRRFASADSDALFTCPECGVLLLRWES